MLTLALGAATGAKQKISENEAIQNFVENKDSHYMSEEQFKKELKDRDPNAVLFASSIDGVFDVTLDEIYQLYEKLGSSRAVIDYLTKQELEKNRNPKITFTTKTTAEQKAAQAAYDLAVQNGQEDTYLPKLDSEQIRNGIDYDSAIEEYKANPELYCFTSVGELENHLNIRPYGEVLFAGTVAKSYGITIDEVYKLIDGNQGDYETVLKLVISD